MQMIVRLASIAALLIAGSVVAQSQRTSPQTGPAAIDVRSYYSEAPLVPGDSQYVDIDGRQMIHWVEELAAFSRKSRDAGMPVWGRIAGDEADAETHQWASDLFKSFGISDVHVQDVALPPQWRATGWDLVARGSGKTLRPASVFPALMSKGTPPQGLDLEAVWIGLGTEADFAGREVSGKLAVIYSWPTSYPHGHSALFLGAMRRAVEHGAAAVLVNRAVPGNQKVIHLPADVPTLYIGTEDAADLRALMAQGPVKVKLALHTSTVTGLRDANVWATLPGTSNEAIYIKAHHDAFFDGALDNATGVATLMALARHYARVPRPQRRYTLHFISLAGHHARADHLWLEDPERPVRDPVLVINLEHTALTSFLTFGDKLAPTTGIEPLRWTVNGSRKLGEALIESFAHFGVDLYDRMEGQSAPPEPGKTYPDYSRPMQIAPSINLIASPQWVYHADNDVPAHIPDRGLASVARAFARLIDRVDTMNRSEISWEPAAATPQRPLTLPAAGPPDTPASLIHVARARRLAGADLPKPLALCNARRAPGSTYAQTRNNWLEPTQVFDNLYYVGSQFVGVWILDTGEGLILFDALGSEQEARDHLIPGMRKLGLDPEQIKYVLVTHGHWDHYGGAQYLRDTFGARIGLAEADWRLMRTLPAERPEFTMPEGLYVPPPEQDLVLTDGMEIPLGGKHVRIYVTPGHSPGTISALIPVRDSGETRILSLLGGTAFPVTLDPSESGGGLLLNSRSVQRLARLSREAGAVGIINTHINNDGSFERMQALRVRQPGQLHPFVIGADTVARHYGVFDECLKAATARRRSAG
jgi:metallo-beta-lactamase class B